MGKSLADLQRDKLEGDAADIDYISTSTAQDVSLGRFFLASTGKLTIAAAGNYRMIIKNPTGSGKTLAIVRLAFMCTVIGWANIFINPSLGVPVTALRRVNNALLGGGGLASLTEVRADTNAITALAAGTGIDTELVLGLPGNQRVSVDLPPFIISPGVTMGINIPVTAGSDLAAGIYWREA